MSLQEAVAPRLATQTAFPRMSGDNRFPRVQALLATTDGSGDLSALSSLAPDGLGSNIETIRSNIANRPRLQTGGSSPSQSPNTGTSQQSTTDDTSPSQSQSNNDTSTFG